jgi:hypothetical protein
MNVRDDDRALRYLLDELPGDERDVFEEEYFDGDGAHAALRATEDELIDSYCAGTLPAERRQRFEERYLGTPEGRERVAFAQSLARYAATRPAAAAAPASAAATTPARARSSGLRLGLAWAAAILLASTAIMSLLSSQREIRRASEARQELQERLAEQQERARAQERRAAEAGRELAALQERARELGELLGPAAEGAQRAVSIVLGGGLRRDGGGAARLALGPGVALARLELRLPGPPRAAYRASLQTPEGRELWARAGLVPSVQDGRATVTFTVPAAALPPGHYVVTLADAAARRRADSDAEFVFEVRSALPRKETP